MLIDCPICAKSYHVGRSELAGGRTLICPRCDASWFVDEDGVSDLASASIRAAKAPAATFTYARAGRGASVLAGTRTVLAGAALLGLLMSAIGARERIVRSMPRLASIYTIAGLPVAPRGLEFANIVSARLASDPSRIAISGAIHNGAARGVALPRLVYELRDAAGLSILSWTEKGPGDIIRSGGTLAFSSAPHVIPDDARTIRVGFEDRRGAGIPLATTLLR